MSTNSTFHVLCLLLGTDLSDQGQVSIKCKEKFQHRGVLLQRYLDCDGELEVQVLYAIQAFVNELQHPAGECCHPYSSTLLVSS